MAPNSTRRRQNSFRRVDLLADDDDLHSFNATTTTGFGNVGSDERFLFDNTPSPGDDDTSETLEDGLISENLSTTPELARRAMRSSRQKPEPRPEERRETWVVFLLRFLLFTILLVACIAVTATTYILFKQQEEEMFKSQFEDFAAKVIFDFTHDLQMRLWSAQMMSTIVGSFSRQQGHSYPNTTLHDWSAISSASRTLAHTSAITFSPILYNDTALRMWEAHISRYHKVGEGSHHEVEHGMFIIDEDSPGNYVDGRMTKEPYAPISQVSTDMNSEKSTMYNQMGSKGRRQAILDCIKSRSGSFSPVLYGEKQYPPHVNPTRPYSIFYATVVDDSKHINGVVGVEYDWEHLFKEKPLQYDGNVIVLTSPTGEKFSFEYKNGEAKFCGKGDLHREEFDDFVVDSNDHFHWHHADDHKIMVEKDEAMHGNGNHRAMHETETNAAMDHMGNDTAMNGMGHPHAVMNETGSSTDPSSMEMFENERYYQISIYPSTEFMSVFVTQKPEYFALGVFLIFVFTSLIFIVYDRFVERRNWRTLATAQKTTALVNSLFPASVQERMLKNEEVMKVESSRKSRRKLSLPEPPKMKIKWFLDEADSKIKDDGTLFSPPIADLFPSTTVMFADIAGFTAWSSEREPTQVFQLLETLYRKFDTQAKKLGVFKVETIGDCYVAVAGLPEPDDDHALIMCKFAWAIKQIMCEACGKLEATLGPGTSGLKLRIGLHSGAVTAGVLRGEKSRFQLFGDTMNTASRMESHSLPDKVQVSNTTAEHIIAKNKGHWLTPRDEMIEAKGKGLLQTYFLQATRDRDRRRTSSGSRSLARSSWASLPDVTSSLNFSDHSPSTDDEDERVLSFANKIQKTRAPVTATSKTSLEHWNADVLEKSLIKVVSRRSELIGRHREKPVVPERSSMTMPIDELVETVELPKFIRNRKASKPVKLSDLVRQQLREFVARIASNYRDVPFHNLEHASHVTMSANKLVNRIVLPQNVDYNETKKNDRIRKEKVAQKVHNLTFGISSDPLAQFAIIFSALIHDVDHTGLTNAQLVKEKTDVAVLYKGQSVAEQNSVTLAWSILMEPQFKQFREAIFSTEEEKKRFRELIVSIIMATDIIDKNLQSLRKKRWETAFSDSPNGGIDPRDIMNRKATIVLEHIIQASDIAHTMQHWHIFCKWNEKLFNEKYWAYVNGHEDNDPASFWYEGEIGFFDGYVIPLAKKLQDCGVFGVSSEEYLGFALENRMEWESKGKEHVMNMHARAVKKYGYKQNLETYHESGLDTDDDESFYDDDDSKIELVSDGEISC